jgi:predicted permease
MVLRYAIPMGLFAGAVSTQRGVLYHDIPFVIAFCAAIIGMYGIGFAVSRVVFRGSTSVAAVVALAVLMPDVGDLATTLAVQRLQINRRTPHLTCYAMQQPGSLPLRTGEAP